MAQKKIAVLVGSLRKESFNRKMAKELIKVSPDSLDSVKRLCEEVVIGFIHCCERRHLKKLLESRVAGRVSHPATRIPAAEMRRYIRRARKFFASRLRIWRIWSRLKK